MINDAFSVCKDSMYFKDIYGHDLSAMLLLRLGYDDDRVFIVFHVLSINVSTCLDCFARSDA